MDDCSGLENRRAARFRGFESLPLRQKKRLTDIVRLVYLYLLMQIFMVYDSDGYS